MEADTHEPYEVPADIGGYGQDRVGCGPLTLVNAIALVVAVLAAWQITGALGLTGPNFSPLWWAQGALILVSGACGVLVTIRLAGMSLLSRAHLWISFQIEQLLGQQQVTPHAPGAGRTRHAGALAIERDGRVVSAPYNPQDTTND
ncbi:MAG TPA: hypothetical protein VFS21_08200 [Roseiflexaceae bacterium]|nr:hypothetical protein [Roseiflexaceae bacterium]